MGKVDILINNAGGNCPESIDEITDESQLTAYAKRQKYCKPNEK